MTPGFLAKAEDAELALLSCLRIDLLTVGAMATEAGITPAHFAGSGRGALYAEIMDCWREGDPCEPLTLIGRMRSAGTLDAIGGPQSLTEALYFHSTAQTAQDHIKALLECAAARRAYAVGQRLCSAACFNVSNDVESLVREAALELDGVTFEAEPEQTSLKTHIHAALDQLEQCADDTNAINFGIGLDETAGPFVRGDLIIIAAGTGWGKSALAGNIVENVALAGKRSAIFSLEMTGAQIAERMIASQGRVNLREYKLSRRRMKEMTNQQAVQLTAVQRAVGIMRDWKVEIVTKAYSLQQAIAKARQIHASGGLDLVMLDYAQLVEGIRDKGDNREREVASISRGLKRLAGELNCVAVLLSQLNDEGKLRESRALGQDANTVLFIDDEGRSIRVGKARSAPAGAEVAVNFRREITRFEAA